MIALFVMKYVREHSVVQNVISYFVLSIYHILKKNVPTVEVTHSCIRDN